MKNQNYVNYKERGFWYSKKKGETKHEEVHLPTAGKACLVVHSTEM